MGHRSRHVRRHGEGDVRRGGRADHSRRKKHLGHLGRQVAKQELAAFLAQMTPEGEKSTQTRRGNQFHGLKIEDDLRILLPADGRQQVEAQVLCHAFRVNFSGGDRQDQNTLLHPTFQVFERRLSHVASRRAEDSPGPMYRQRGVKANHSASFCARRLYRSGQEERSDDSRRNLLAQRSKLRTASFLRLDAFPIGLIAFVKFEALF